MTASVIYLHGFPSSPASGKVKIFAQEYARRGLTLRVPDLNAPDFERATLTAMLQRAAEAIAECPPGPVYLIGSSMGAAVALHTVQRYAATAGGRVHRMAFLAPALRFEAGRFGDLDDEQMARWKADGVYPFFHHAYGEERPLHYGFVEDVARYDAFAAPVTLPILIVHGLRDDVVDYRDSVRFAEGRPNVTLRLVDSDHQLYDKAAWIAGESLAFFGL